MSKHLVLTAAAIILCCSLLFIQTSSAEKKIAPAPTGTTSRLRSATVSEQLSATANPQGNQKPVRKTTAANPADYNAIADYGTTFENDGIEITVDAISLASETTDPDGRERLEFNATLRNNNIGYFSRVHLLFDPSGDEWTNVEIVRDFTSYFDDLVPNGTSVAPQTLVLLAPAAVAATVRDQILAKQKLRIQAFELYQFRLPAVALDAGAIANFIRINPDPIPDGHSALEFSAMSPALAALTPGTLLLESPSGPTSERGEGPLLKPLAGRISSDEVYVGWQTGTVRTTRMVEVTEVTVNQTTDVVTVKGIQYGSDPNPLDLPYGPFNGPEYRGLIDNLKTGTVSCSAATAFDPITDPALQNRHPYQPSLGNSAFTESENLAREDGRRQLVGEGRVRHGKMRDLNGLFALHFPLNDLKIAPGITLDGQVTLGGLNVKIDVRRRNNADVIAVQLSTRAEINLRLTAQAGANNRGGQLFDREKKIVNVPLPAVVFAIGAVPVTIQPVFSAKVGATLDAPTSIVIPLQSSMETGVTMECDPLKPPGQQCTYTPFKTINPLGVSKPALTEALAFTASVFAETRMEILVDDLAGPYVGARVTGEFGLTPLAPVWWNLDARLDFEAGFVLSLLGVDIADAGHIFPGPTFFHKDAGGPLINHARSNRPSSAGPSEPAEGADVRWGRGAFWDGGAIPNDAILERVRGSAEDVFMTLPAPNSIYSPVARIGAKGELIWAQTAIGALPEALGAMPDGGLMVAGKNFNAHYLTRLDGAGHEIWSRNFNLVDDTGGPQNVYIRSIVTREVTPGNYEIFVCGYRDNGLNTLDTDPFMVKYDGAGTMLFSKRFASLDTEVVDQAILLHDGNLLFVGRNKKSPDGIVVPGPGSPDGGWLMKVRPDGSFIQALRSEAGLNMGYSSVTEAPDGTIFAGGTQGHTVVVEYPSLVIARYASDLQVQELVTIGEAMLRDKSNVSFGGDPPPPGGPTQGFHDWLPNAGLTLFDFATKLEWTQSGLIAGGITGLGDDRAALLMCFTDKLNLRWFTTEEGGRADTLLDFVATDDGLLTAGFTTSLAGPGVGAPGAMFFKVPYEGKVDLDPSQNGLAKYLQPSIYNLKSSFDDPGFPGPAQGYAGTFPSLLVSSPQVTIPGVQPPPYSPFSFSNWTSLAQANTAPTITTTDYSPLAVQQGASANSSIAKGSDKETSAGSLIVTATSVPAGIGVTNIVNTSGTITANVAVDCAATLGDHTVVLQISDGALTSTTNLIVDVTANTAPSLTYGSASVVSAGSTNINAASGLTDNGTVQLIALQSQGTYTGGIVVDNTTGQVSISNAAPVGTHTITIRATDNCGVTTDSQFVLTVTDAPNTCTAVVTNGNWSVTATWGCGHVPLPGDTIIIPPGTHITLDIDPLGVSIIVSPGAILTILGNRTLLNNLIVNGTLNFTISGSQTTHSPQVASNNLITGNNVVSISCGGVITGASASGFVVGNLKKDYCAPGTFTFPVGSNTHGDEYSPVDVNVTALGSNPASLTVKTSYGTAPATPSFVDAVTLDRYWTLTESGDLTADLTFNYLATDVTAAEANLGIFRVSSGAPTLWPNSAPDTVNHKATAVSVSAFSDWTLSVPAGPTAAVASISGQVTMPDGRPLGGVTVRLNGSRSDRAITNANGEYNFADLETGGFYVVTPALANYSISPFNRTFTLVGNKTDAVFTATSVGESTNLLDGEDFFVRQQYLDFLDREPDHDGWLYWTDQIARCGDDLDCVRLRRLDVSSAFFVEQEFQRTGSFVYRLYQGSLGRQPSYAEFVAARGRVRADGALLENQAAFVADWTERAEFAALYPASLTNAAFVTKLFAQAGLAELVAEQQQQLAAMAAGRPRAQVVRELIEIQAFQDREYNRSFVLMQYFGYLQRDADRDGYDFWLSVLNGGRENYRGMVCAFVTSMEYQRRFSQIVSHANGECGNQ